MRICKDLFDNSNGSQTDSYGSLRVCPSSTTSNATRCNLQAVAAAGGEQKEEEEAEDPVSRLPQVARELLGHALWEWSARKDDAVKRWAEKLLRFFGQRCPSVLLTLPWQEGISRGRNWFVRRKQVGFVEDVLLRQNSCCRHVTKPGPVYSAPI